MHLESFFGFACAASLLGLACRQAIAKLKLDNRLVKQGIKINT